MDDHQLAALRDAVVKHFKADKAVVVGHDWGGIVAWSYAMAFPDKTDRLVILNLPMVGVWVRLLRVPYRLLYPAIIVFCCIGAYTINSKPFDAYVMAFFAIFGYVVNLLAVPALAPFVLRLLVKFGSACREFLDQQMRDAASAVERAKHGAAISGELPSPVNPPSGCSFHPRCRFAVEKCKQEIPDLAEKEPNRFAACIRIGEI